MLSVTDLCKVHEHTAEAVKKFVILEFCSTNSVTTFAAHQYCTQSYMLKNKYPFQTTYHTFIASPVTDI